MSATDWIDLVIFVSFVLLFVFLILDSSQE